MTTTPKRVKKQKPIYLRMKGFWVQLCLAITEPPNLERRSTAPTTYMQPDYWEDQNVATVRRKLVLRPL